MKGTLITRTEDRHTHVEWLRFLKQINRETPKELDVHRTRYRRGGARLDNVSPALLTTRLSALMEIGVAQRKALPGPFNAQVYAPASAVTLIRRPGAPPRQFVHRTIR